MDLFVGGLVALAAFRSDLVVRLVTGSAGGRLDRPGGRRGVTITAFTFGMPRVIERERSRLGSIPTRDLHGGRNDLVSSQGATYVTMFAAVAVLFPVVARHAFLIGQGAHRGESSWSRMTVGAG